MVLLALSAPLHSLLQIIASTLYIFSVVAGVGSTGMAVNDKSDS